MKNDNRSVGAQLGRRPVSYDDNGTCSCAFSEQCSMPARMFDHSGNNFYTLNDLRLGCTIFESPLQSSFECFYSQACVDQLATALPVGWYWNDPLAWNASGRFKPINSSYSTFAPSDTGDTIVNRMFINRWRQEISYEAFFQGCAPRECTYTRHYRFDALDVITTFLSVFGDLSIALRFLVPHGFRFIDKIRHRARLRFLRF